MVRSPLGRCAAAPSAERCMVENEEQSPMLAASSLNIIQEVPAHWPSMWATHKAPSAELRLTVCFHPHHQTTVARPTGQV